MRLQRGRRFRTGLNVCVSLLLAATLTGMLGYLACRHYVRLDLSRSDYYKLSGKTKGLIAGLESDVNVVGFFRRSHLLHDDIKKLLREYRYEASRAGSARLKIRLVDPDRDLVEARELKRRFELAEVDTILIECEGRLKLVEEKDLADYEIQLTEGGAVRRWTGFKGEQAVSSGIQSVIQSRRPVVYFLCGHGERSITDFSKHAGFSTLGRTLARDNIEVRDLQLSRETGIPEDCSALVIASPDRNLLRAELDMISAYLAASGRLLVLVDPATDTGLEPLLQEWGIRLGSDFAVDPTRTLTGRELVVAGYGDHAITRRLRNMTTVFYMPRAVEPLPGSRGASDQVTDDRPHVSVLASSTDEGWAETDVDQNPPRFDREIERPGPVSVAVAVEKGNVSGIDLEIKPTRVVAVGDSYFVSNGALGAGVGGNTDFFMSVVNWLVEREALLAIGPRAPGELRLDMNKRDLRAAYAVICGGIPVVIAFAGFLVWLLRRR